jgi:hypothetical protein
MGMCQRERYGDVADSEYPPIPKIAAGEPRRQVFFRFMVKRRIMLIGFNMSCPGLNCATRNRLFVPNMAYASARPSSLRLAPEASWQQKRMNKQACEFSRSSGPATSIVNVRSARVRRFLVGREGFAIRQAELGSES